MKRLFLSCGKPILLTSIVILIFGRALPAQVVDFITDGNTPFEQSPQSVAMEGDTRDGSPIEFGNLFQDQFAGWSIDYRARTIFNSFTSYEFGLPETDPVNWSPLSKLVFPVNSTWHGLQIERQTPNTDLRFEWLTPIGNGIDGHMNDYDWMIPGADFTDLGITRERWDDGQMINLNLQYRLLDHLVFLPVEFWLSGGFRWQRFGLTAYDAVQVKEDNVWPPIPWSYGGDVITFNQQYYSEYLGGELRTTLAWIPTLPLELRLSGDYGAAQGYNIDHHLLREGDMYVMHSTGGNTWHYAASAELHLKKNFSIGAQYDFLNIDTHGVHRWVNAPFDIDESWHNGVHVQSEQTWLTIYFRLSV
jgi:hypothetical protein